MVLPPGAGKTAVGLEVARRGARNTLVLCANPVVQEQWLRAWRDFLPEQGPPPVRASGERAPGPLVVLPWSDLTVWERPQSARADADLSAQRSAAVRGRGDLLALLHPAGRDLVERAARAGPWLVVLDDADALLESWGPLATAVVRALGPRTHVLGLASTSPARLPPRARAAATDLLGPPVLSEPLGAAVREGAASASQHLVAYCEPLPDELAALAPEAERFESLTRRLLQGAGSLPLPAWLARRTQLRPLDAAGAALSWSAWAASEPELSRAALRLAAAGHLALPPGARLQQQHRAPAAAQDWAVVLGAYALEHLEPSDDPADRALLAEVAAVLPGLGRRLTRGGLRPTASPVDLLVARSAAKPLAAARVLRAELDARGDALRALVVCDADDDPAPGRSATGARLALRALATGELGTRTRPVLVTGRRVAAAPDVAQALRRWCAAQGVPGLRSVPLDGLALYELVSDRPGWGPRVWGPLVTDYLTSGGSGVLGEHPRAARHRAGTRRRSTSSSTSPPARRRRPCSGCTVAGCTATRRARRR